MPRMRMMPVCNSQVTMGYIQTKKHFCPRPIKYLPIYAYM